MLARSEALSIAAFRDYWYGTHANIVRGIPHLHRYRQNHILRPIGNPVGGADYRVDGIPELWFVDESAKAAAFQSPAAKALPADEKNFIKGITIFAVDEVVVREGHGAAKVFLLVRRSGIDGDELDDERRWSDQLCTTLPGVRRCVMNRLLSSDHRQGVWHEPLPPSLIVELRFDNDNEAEAALQSEAYTAPAESAARRGACLAAYLVEERPII